MTVLLKCLVFFLIVFPMWSRLGGETANAPAEVEIEPGDRVIVKLHRNLGPNLKGEVVSVDKDCVVVEPKNGEAQAVEWESVRVIKTWNPNSGRWIGMAAGAAFAAAALGTSGDAGAAAAGAFVGAGACAGALTGHQVDEPREVLYRAPKEEDPR